MYFLREGVIKITPAECFFLCIDLAGSQTCCYGGHYENGFGLHGAIMTSVIRRSVSARMSSKN